MALFHWRAGLLAGALLALPAVATRAEEPARTFAVSETQARALGVELVTLQTLPDTAGARFPAQVVLPPQAETVISAPVTGLISQVLIQENQAVDAGTPLLKLSSPELGQLQLAAVQAASRAALAGQTLTRERSLFKDGIIPERRVQEADAAAREADAALQQARAALDLAGLATAEIDQVLHGGQVAGELVLRARAAGTVTSLAVKPGQRVNAADPLLHLARLDTLWLDVQIPSGEASRWPTGARVLTAGGAEGRVLSISPVTSGAQTVLLRAQLDSGAAALRPGEFVQAELPLPADAAWEVPIAALARHDGQAYVFKRVETGFTAVPVTVLASAGQRAKLAGELAAGDRLAVSSVVALKAAWLGLGGAEEE